MYEDDGGMNLMIHSGEASPDVYCNYTYLGRQLGKLGYSYVYKITNPRINTYSSRAMVGENHLT
jgi:hypothetical protein